MDALLASLGMYAVNCAGRLAVKNGIALTAKYTTKQCSRLLKTIDDKRDRAELKELQKLLDSKIKILSPVIDLIEFKSGRGNVFLESAVPLAKSLHRDIVSLGKRLEAAAAVEEAISSQPGIRTIRVTEQQHMEVLGIIDEIKSLLARIDRDIPLLQLAITGSGETLSNSMPSGISPSRLMQASTFVSIGDTQFSGDPTRPVQIGPSFTISLYMLFLGHSSSQPQTNGDCQSGESPATPDASRSGGKQPKKQEPYGLGEGERIPIWQEIIHKARIRLCRTPLGWVFDREKGYCPDLATNLMRTSSDTAQSAFARSSGYSYHLEIVEDLDDGRLHDEEGQKHQPFDNIAMAGVRESLPIHQISKVFYTNTGKLLNIGSSTDNNPVLLLKRDAQAASPSQLREEWEEESCSVRREDAAGSEASDTDDVDQSDIDRQLFEENKVLDTPQEDAAGIQDKRKWEFPQHVDQEWFALEVFVEDEEDDSDNENDDDYSEDRRSETAEGDGTPSKQLAAMKVRLAHGRSSSVDINLLEQIRNISIRSPMPASPQIYKSQQGDMDKATLITDSPESFVARSPFGAITSSLSLMEMLIRLTSLQEFQQTSHLAIPDYILTFFLEETSTTGLQGEQRWKTRNEAKKRVGFDPYTDTPY
ncbi:Ran-binding-domain-containing protein [Coniochaeta sp. PMI_546]|nr:Ran-binding-domain-containing protein [Coniochaeta sp. PMI_546]